MTHDEHRGPPDLRNRKNWSQFQAAFTSLVEQFHANGSISPDDLENPERLRTRLDELLAPGFAIIGIVDHRDRIIEYANRFTDDGEYELALVFYALYFEHTLNVLIQRQLDWLQKGPEVTKGALRSVTFENKLGWFLDLIDLPALNPKYAKAMLQIASERNAFVHYKWQPFPETAAEKDRARLRLQALVASARKSVSYLKRYEARLLHGGMKGKISEVSKLARPADWP
jgi:hypothetical protein